jgi:hypothetical protein
MGRTLPTFNTYLHEEIEAWRPFRRALSPEGREALDRLFTRARRHVAAATCVARPIPFDALIVSILLDQELELARQRAEIERLRSEG